MKTIIEKFGHKIRVRACGLIYDENSILLVNHSQLNKSGEFWAPPGGGVELGESASSALRRELHEECGITVESARFQLINEFINLPLHAVEFFFLIKSYSGTIKKGQDPELKNEQIIKETRFVTFRELNIMKESKKHNILHVELSRAVLDSMHGHVLYAPNT